MMREWTRKDRFLLDGSREATYRAERQLGADWKGVANGRNLDEVFGDDVDHTLCGCAAVGHGGKTARRVRRVSRCAKLSGLMRLNPVDLKKCALDDLVRNIHLKASVMYDLLSDIFSAIRIYAALL